MPSFVFIQFTAIFCCYWLEDINVIRFSSMSAVLKLNTVSAKCLCELIWFSARLFRHILQDLYHQSNFCFDFVTQMCLFED